MGYLDDLKRQSEALREKQETAQAGDHEEQAIIDELRPTLKVILKYMEEFVDVANFVNPEVPVNYDIEGYGRFTNMRQEAYSVNTETDDREELTKVVFRFECTDPNPQVRTFAVEGREEFLKQREYLWRNNFQFKDKASMTGGSFYLEPKVIVRLEFTPDPKKRRIKLVVRNLSFIGSAARWIDPDVVSQDALDDLAGLVLRKSDELDKLSTGQMTDEMRRRIQEGLRQEQERRQMDQLRTAIKKEEAEQDKSDATLVRRLRRNLGTLVHKK